MKLKKVKNYLAACGCFRTTNQIPKYIGCMIASAFNAAAGSAKGGPNIADGTASKSTSVVAIEDNNFTDHLLNNFF